MMSMSQPWARACAAISPAVALLPPPVPAAMRMWGSSCWRSATHLPPPGRAARWMRCAGSGYSHVLYLAAPPARPVVTRCAAASAAPITVADLPPAAAIPE